MRKRIVQSLGVALGLALSARSAAAQGVELGIGGGVTLPLSDFGDAYKTGFNGQASVGFRPATLPVGFEIDGNYIRNSFDSDVLDVDNQLIAGTANIVYTFATSETSSLKPYLIGGVGLYNSKSVGDDALSDESTTDFGIDAGAGFNYGIGGANAFLEGRFHNIFSDPDNLNLVNVNAGVKFLLGGTQ